MRNKKAIPDCAHDRLRNGVIGEWIGITVFPHSEDEQ